MNKLKSRQNRSERIFELATIVLRREIGKLLIPKESRCLQTIVCVTDISHWAIM